MASIVMLIGALANALAFTGSSYLFSRLFKDSTEAKRNRHNEAIEQLQKAQIEWVHKHKSKLTVSINNSGWKVKQKANLQNPMMQ